MATEKIGSGVQHDVELAKKEAKMHIEEAKKHIAEAEKMVEQKIKDDPVKAVAIAAGVGALVGGLAVFLAKRKQQ